MSETKDVRPEIVQIFAQNVSRLLNVYGISRADLARKLGVDTAKISHVLNGSKSHGQGNVKIATLQRWADALDVEPFQLLAPVPNSVRVKVKDLETVARDVRRKANVFSRTVDEILDGNTKKTIRTDSAPFTKMALLCIEEATHQLRQENAG